ncbi:MAG: hypothetical protein AAFX03_13430 [Pseudomonadota bacterium]
MSDDLNTLFADLPEEPYYGSFVLFERLSNLLPPEEARTEREYGYACGVLEAYFDAVGLRPPTAIAENSSDSGGPRKRHQMVFAAFQSRIEINYTRHIKQLASEAIEQQTEGMVGFAALSVEEKARVQHLMERARRLFGEAGMDERNMAAINLHVSRLMPELQRQLVRTGPFFALAGDMALAARPLGSLGGQAMATLGDMLRVLLRARARLEKIELPPEADPLSAFQLSPTRHSAR